MLKGFYSSPEYWGWRRRRQQADFACGMSFGLLLGTYGFAAQLVW